MDEGGRLDQGRGQPGEVVRLDDERRHEIEQAAKGPDPDPLLHKEPLEYGHVHRLSGLDHPNGSQHADISHGRQGPGRFQFYRQLAANGGHPFLPGTVQQQADRGAGYMAGERVAHEGRAVHEYPGRSAGDGGGDQGGGQSRGQGQVAAGDRLAHAQDIRCNPGMLGGKELAGTAKSRGDLIKDQQDVVVVA